jgi:pantoate--beta-alanine ligase
LAETRSVQIVRTVRDVRDVVSAWHADRQSVALVPTLGNLHAGHMSLAALAAESCDRVVMSVFVNPTQFGAGEDLAAYPRTSEEDSALVTAAGTVDLLFAPSDREVYPFGIEDAVRVVLPALAHDLCGTSRPGHFDGVASVVCRLLNIVAPDVLVLGQKDYQQCILVQRMITDLGQPVSLRVGPTVRETDGLAMSSRNRYLDAQQRMQAPLLQATLEQIRNQLRAGAKDYARLTGAARETLERAGLKPDYVEIRRAADLSQASAADLPEHLVVLGAAWLGRARLIDNLRV